MTDSLFHWSRDIPREWEVELARLAPPLSRVSHLTLMWESGTPLDPVSRWVIYEAVPLAFVPDWKQEAFFSDPPCRCATPWTPERCEKCHGLNSPGRSRILDYLLKTECLALPYWVIQGSHGGHKHRYSQVEQQWQRMVGHQDTPPDPGSLPYAEFDQRVVRKLRSHNRAWSAFGNLLNAHEDEKQQALLAFRKALLRYVDHSVEAEFDALTLSQKAGLVDEVRTDFTQDSAPPDLEAARDHFLTGV